MLDPHPKNQGSGIDILVKAGIEVKSGILEKEVINDLQSHLFKSS